MPRFFVSDSSGAISFRTFENPNRSLDLSRSHRFRGVTSKLTKRSGKRVKKRTVYWAALLQSGFLTFRFSGFRIRSSAIGRVAILSKKSSTLPIANRIRSAVRRELRDSGFLRLCLIAHRLV